MQLEDGESDSWEMVLTQEPKTIYFTTKGVVGQVDASVSQARALSLSLGFRPESRLDADSVVWPLAVP